MRRSSPARVPVRPVASLLLAAGLLAGCATSKPKEEVFWPEPPDKPRIRHVRAIRTADDLDLGFGRKVLKTVVPGDPLATIRGPFALALSPDERRLYVSSTRPTRIVAVDLEGRKMKLFANAAKQQPGLISGLAIDAEENVYVSDRAQSVVLVYDREGSFLRKFGADRLQAPTSIAIDRKGQVVYVLNGATSGQTDHRVEVFALKGNHLRTIGKRGEGPGEFNFPSGVTVAPDRKLYVVDKLNFRIQVFDPGGAAVEQFGVLGTGMAGMFDKIRGLAFDAFGNMYVVDTMQGVHILNPRRRALMLFGNPPFLAAPNAIVVDSKNRIFVSDFGQNAVHEFVLVNTTAADSYLEPAPAPAGNAPAPAPAGKVAPTGAKP